MKHEIDYVTKNQKDFKKDAEKFNNKKDFCNEYAGKTVIASAILALIYGFMRMAGGIYPEMNEVSAKWVTEIFAGGALASFMTASGFKAAAIHFKDLAKKCEKAAQEMIDKNKELGVD